MRELPSLQLTINGPNLGLVIQRSTVMKTKPQHQIDFRVLGLALALFMTFASPGHGQKLRSRYNLSAVKIGLMNGERFRGTMTSFTEDSLALMDAHIAPPGSSVALYSRDMKSLHGTVESVTRENIIIFETTRNQLIKVPRNRITSFHVKKCACSKEELKQFQQRWFHYSSIKYISLHKSGSGATGGLIGMGVGAAAGAVIASGNQHPDPPGTFNFKIISDEAGGMFVGGLLGLAAGIPLGLINNQMFIDGDHGKFLEVRRVIVKP